MDIRTTTGVEVVLTACAALDADQQDETLVRLLALHDQAVDDDRSEGEPLIADMRRVARMLDLASVVSPRGG